MTAEAVQDALDAATRYVSACDELRTLEINLHTVDKKSREHKLYERASQQMSDALFEIGQQRLFVQFKNY